VKRLRAAALAAILPALTLFGCASREKPEPAALEAFTPKLTGQQIWSRHLGGPSLVGQQIAVIGENILLATRQGDLLKIDGATGTVRERASLGRELAAGVGSDGLFSAVVTRNNDLVVVSGGRVLWEVRLKARVLTAPLVAGERIFVQSIDRVIEAYDARDGRRLWTLSRPGDPLSLAQTGVLLPYQNTLLTGSGSRLVGLDPLLGSVRSEVVLAAPRGTNEVERLADLVGPAARSGDVVCARAFQVAVGCIDAGRSSVLWSRPQSGFQGVAIDTEQRLFSADATDRISAWRVPTGDVIWTTERLRNRGLSAPAVLGRAVVFGDDQGWVHFLSIDKGETLLRWSTDSSGISVAPVRVAGLIVVLSRAGYVYGLRAE
jgi:outer membrane protein assembly factor BamB